MNFQSQLRNRQDRLRNAGWRIQWIPWWELGKPEVIHSNNPLPLLGIVVFIGVFFWNNFNFFGITLTMPQVILISILGFGLAVLGILVSTMQAQSNWKKITAQCIDREICKGAKEPGAISSFWAYRLVCMFRFDGNPYKVTPNPSHSVAFTSEQQVHKYLDQRIGSDGSCILWINPNNPLQTVFHKKRWWL